MILRTASVPFAVRRALDSGIAAETLPLPTATSAASFDASSCPLTAAATFANVSPPCFIMTWMCLPRTQSTLVVVTPVAPMEAVSLTPLPSAPGTRATIARWLLLPSTPLMAMLACVSRLADVDFSSWITATCSEPALASSLRRCPRLNMSAEPDTSLPA